MTVRELREKLGWTQQRMAVEVGVGVRSISDWELYGKTPRGKYIMRLWDIAMANGIEGFSPNCPCCGRPL